MADFQKAVDLILNHEGGYSNNPADPGGETAFGISKRAYPNLDMKTLTRMDAIQIYKNDYWEPIRGEKILDQRLAGNLLDFAVTSGVNLAARTIQRLVNVVTDGHIGPVSITAINSDNPAHLNLTLVGERLAFYVGLAAGKSGLRYALKSWIRRTADYA